MAKDSGSVYAKTAGNVHRAVEREGISAGRKLQDQLFSLAFSGLVYAQIWEDPVIDLEALALLPTDRVIAVASGGCNVMSYLTANPASITAVDLNAHHVALNWLRITAARTLPRYEVFRDFFAKSNHAENAVVYKTMLRPALDPTTRAYWDGRDLIGRRRFRYFTRNVYHHGLLGRFIGFGHLLGRMNGVDPAVMLTARDMDEQRVLFDRHFAGLFDKPHMHWLARRRASLYGLGIPPAQYDALASSARDDSGMAGVLRDRLAKLACDFPIQDNYFAWQAFGRGYKPAGDGPLPPYLQPQNYDAVRSRADRIDVRQVNIIDHLAAQPTASLDAYVLLDTQDWMSDAVLTRLWTEITRTARPGARVVFRTAAEESVLPGRIPDDLLVRWAYDAERCRDFTRRDRSAIYGGVHLYTLRPVH